MTKEEKVGNEFAKYLQSIHPSNIMLKEKDFVGIWNHWYNHIYQQQKQKL